MTRKIKIMIIDPDQGSREGMKRLLDLEFNSEIRTTGARGEIALKEVLIFEPDIVLTEINLDGLDGFFLMELIKSRLPATQLVVVSVQDDAHYMRQAFQSGAFDFVAKPITSGELIYCVERAYLEHLRTKEQLAEAERTRALQRQTLPQIQVFVSYSREDWEEFVEPLVKFLPISGVHVWVDQHTLRGGDEWVEKIGKALTESHYMILCLSPTALASKWVRREYTYFLTEDKPIIPLLCRPIERLPFELRGLQYHSYDLSSVSDLLRDYMLGRR